MSKYELTGTIKQISDTQTFPSGFCKRQFVVTTTDSKYPQDIALEFVKDACVKLDSFQEGGGCKVTFDIRGNEYNGRHYVQLAAWKIERTDDGLGIRSPEYGKSDKHNQAKQDGYQPQRRTDQNGAGVPRDNGAVEYADDDSDIPFARPNFLPF